ncbi:large conductance mechanosensitive channel protein MscL [Bacillus sp. RG28]|uniref:Large-conductance mechanosensitive channel n=1 Tax=Gottfriedia endophytica TaxID=2820819 RepID=A0A940SL56_9BACI|nr:large conductance mechanosensitive channel protein MscL [Gottfriedia endophytica]MBP0727126.1 large conductance mechanosensitive channel protein MscL [Gottfriedia endophytica]
MLEEFKKFALKGNVLDLAVGVIMGGAFGKIVSSLVSDIMMPILGLLLGGKDFSKLSYTHGKATIAYGMFIQSIVDFLIISVSIFIFIKLINKLTSWKKTKEEEIEEKEIQVLTKQEELLVEIRDLLKAQKQNASQPE